MSCLHSCVESKNLKRRDLVLYISGERLARFQPAKQEYTRQER